MMAQRSDLRTVRMCGWVSERGRGNERETIDPDHALMSPTSPELSSQNEMLHVSARYHGGEADALLNLPLSTFPLALPARAVDDAIKLGG